MSSSATARVWVARIDRVEFTRFDQDTVRIDEETGYLRVWGQIGRVGLLEYGVADGAPFDGWTELVPESTLFDEASNRTLLHAPVTLQHPPDFLTADNTNRFQIGTIIDLKEDRAEGTLRGHHLITDGPSIAEIRAGVSELSPGYTTRVVGPSGTFDGVRFDGTQVDRRYNHNAVVTEARAGPSNALDRVDALKRLARIFRADGLRIQLKTGGNMSAAARKKLDAELTIGDTTHSVPQDVVDAFRAIQADNESQAKVIADAEATAAAAAKDAEHSPGTGGDDDDDEEDKDKATVKADKAPVTMGTLKTLLEAVRTDSTKDILAALDKRDTATLAASTALAEIVTTAKPMLAESYRMDGKTAGAIMVAAITESVPVLKAQANAALNADDMSRLRGIFDTASTLGKSDGGSGDGKGGTKDPKLEKGDAHGGSRMAKALELRKARVDATRGGGRFTDQGTPVRLAVLAGEGKE